MQKLSKIVPAVCIALFVLVSLDHPTTAQTGPAQQELSQHLAALVRSKWEMIEVETAGAKEEWAGRYRASEGPTITTNLAWSPVSGFIVWWENCSRPTSSRVNHGGAVLQDGLLKLTPQVSENTPGSFSVSSEFVPVKWGAQHFLIPHDQLMKFIYAVNSRSVSEIETFLLKVEDNDKKPRGVPAVPPQYVRHLRMKPINAAISGVGRKVGQWHPHVILNVGRKAGVIREMKFYRYWRGVFVVLEVINVDEHSAEAAVVTVSTTRNTNDEIQVKAGWKFSSRAPIGYERWMP